MDEEYELDPSGRVTIVTGGELLPPAQCLMCGISGANVEQKFLDIKRDIDDYGIIYFCIDCGMEIGLASDCVPRKDFSALALANEQLTETNEQQESILERLGDGLERDLLAWLNTRGVSLNPSGDGFITDSDVNAPDDGSDDEFLYGAGESDSDSTASDTESTDDTTESDESSTDDGPNGPSESASDNTPAGNYVGSLEL